MRKPLRRASRLKRRLRLPQNRNPRRNPLYPLDLHLWVRNLERATKRSFERFGLLISRRDYQRNLMRKRRAEDKARKAKGAEMTDITALIKPDGNGGFILENTTGYTVRWRITGEHCEPRTIIAAPNARVHWMPLPSEAEPFNMSVMWSEVCAMIIGEV